MAEISVEDRAFLNILISSDSFGNASFYEKPTVGDKVAILPLFNRNNNTYHYDDFRDYNPETDKNLSFMRKSVWLGNKQDSEIVYFIIDSDSCPKKEYPNLPIEFQYALFSLISDKNKRIPKFFDELVRINGISFLDTVFDAIWRDSKDNTVFPAITSASVSTPLNIRRDKSVHTADTGLLFIDFVNRVKNTPDKTCYNWLRNMRPNTRFIMTLDRYSNVDLIMSVILGENWFSTIVGKNEFNTTNTANVYDGGTGENMVFSDVMLQNLNSQAKYYNIYMRDFEFNQNLDKNTAILHDFFSTLNDSARISLANNFVSCESEVSGNGQTLPDILPMILHLLEAPKNKAILAHAMSEDLVFTVAMLFQIASDYERFRNNFSNMAYIAENAIIESINEFFNAKSEFIAKNGENSYDAENNVYCFHERIAMDLFSFLMKLDRVSKFTNTKASIYEQDISDGDYGVNVQCNSYIRAITRENVNMVDKISKVLLSNIKRFSADTIEYVWQAFDSAISNSSTNIKGELSYMLIFHEFLTILSQKFSKSDDEALTAFIKKWAIIGAKIDGMCSENYNILKKLVYGYNFTSRSTFNGNGHFISLIIMVDLLKNKYFDTMTVEMVIEHVKMRWFSKVDANAADSDW